ncbi:unnamed protein product [Bursaphelenchus okinawaensis]|uniref:39S ribosomal protein L55, mitochondrial n=1 Tax=Bursaphelenchus okinawaensis TaxID=465554 RepID=A0A811KS53_9BILA|nr:unnamed protein product [Bursaphelenchus okinawaensis]CAG9112254.1 unnamed protein product [Bursaphelenchus okinawaensis]
MLATKYLTFLNQARCFSVSSVDLNANRACLGRPSRTKYVKQYKVTLMNSDGSTVEARYPKPLHFVRLPLDLRIADESERRQRLALRKPQVKRIKEEVIDDNFDASDYLKYFKK